MTNHFLHDFLNPQSIAIYGANNTFGTTMGTMLLIRIINSNYMGKIYPIHLKLDKVLGFKAYRAINQVPEIPDLVIIVLPPNIVPQIFRECGEKGVKRIYVVSGGFRELGGERANTLTEEIIEIANFYGIRFIGPNCLGIYNNWIHSEDSDRFNMMIINGDHIKRSKFSIVSQSGTLASHLWMDPNYPNYTLGKAISIGNEANIDLVDFLEYLKSDEQTDVIGLYIEEVKRGRHFIKIIKEIIPKKPVIAIYGGGSKVGNRAISSHTGSLGGNLNIYNAMIKETGIIKTDFVEEFLDLASILSSPNFQMPKGKRIGIITISGGPGVLIANNAESNGLKVPEFSSELKANLAKILPSTASWSNPVDVTFDMNLFNLYINIPKLLMKSEEIDIIIIYGALGIGSWTSTVMQNPKIAEHVKLREDMSNSFDELGDIFIAPTIKTSQKYGIPIIYINPQNNVSNWSEKIREHGGIIFKFWDRPVNRIAKICNYSAYLSNFGENKKKEGF